MARISIREKKQRRSHMLWGSAALLMALFIVGLAAYFLVTAKDDLNSETLCPSEGPLGHYILLVDKTDPLSFIQKEAFQVELESIVRHKLPEGYLFSVFSLGENFQNNAKPLVELCNPGDGKEKSHWTTTVSILQKQYQEKFLTPLLQKSEELVSAKHAKESPIFEMIQLVSINGFQKHAVKGEKKLIIMSDMLHNTSQFNMYKSKFDFEDFAVSPYGKKSQLELSNVSVELYYLMNTPSLQTRKHALFWEQFFNNSGARVVAIRPLGG
ncbi:hypothetical protein [Nitrosomonas sp. Nm58]|uniref:hypothetical protein n=1 Tax=Nitrosomonas sp. Nm58 TaxID=200126 RepID=UPI00089753D6|nr:hypothetical protein [Nitrosomonas sp. Nm58]SDZ14202.1 hypothetical protein SAMN05421754_10724 [Nitrosomonas sp. Nm58]